MKRRILMAAAALAALLLGACKQRELCYDHSHTVSVEVRFDWSAAPDATPRTMVVWAFPADGGAGTRFELPEEEGSFDARIGLPSGSYRMVCFNGDTDTNCEQGTSLDDFVIRSTEEGLLVPLDRSEEAPRPPQTEGEPVRAAASPMWAHVHERMLTIAPGDVATPTPHTVRFTPRRVTAVWDVRVEEVRNLKPGVKASAVVTGVGEAWQPRTQKPCGACVTVPFGLEPCGTDCLKGSVILFGDTKDPDVKHVLRVYTSYRYYYDYDITGQVHAAPDPLHVAIVVRGMTLPDLDNGLAPGVDDWADAEEQEVLM